MRTRTLNDLSPGTQAVISDIRCSPETLQRLRTLGFAEDVPVRSIVQTRLQLICEVANTRVGMDRSVAEHVIVTAAPRRTERIVNPRQ